MTMNRNKIGNIPKQVLTKFGESKATIELLQAFVKPDVRKHQALSQSYKTRGGLWRMAVRSSKIPEYSTGRFV